MERGKVQYAICKFFCPRSVLPVALINLTDSMAQQPPGMEGLELCAEGDVNVWKSWGNTTFREYIPSKEA